jgi:hypothetical protein
MASKPRKKASAWGNSEASNDARVMSRQRTLGPAVRDEECLEVPGLRGGHTRWGPGEHRGDGDVAAVGPCQRSGANRYGFALITHHYIPLLSNARQCMLQLTIL